MRKTLIWLLCFACLIGFISYLASGEESDNVGYSEFVGLIEKGEFKKIVIDPHEKTLKGVREDGGGAMSHYVGDEDMAERFRATGIAVEVRPTNTFNPWPLVMLGVFVLIFIFLFRALARMGGGATNFAKSKVKREDPREIGVRFDDVKGCEEAKREVMEYLDFAKDPHRFLRFNVKMPSGILLVGPTGTGKTMLAKALACEANVPFFSMSGSDFVEMFVGVGAARVRDTMEVVRKEAPSILFIDEIDAVGRKRGAGFGNQNDEREQTLNQILVELDGISNTPDVLVIAATNRPDVLDPALLRKGRLDRQVHLLPPDVSGRQAILESYARLKPLAEDVDLATLARMTFSFNGADLNNLVNEAGITAARRNGQVITMSDFETALEKISLGTERRLVMVEDERRRVAIHEAGHALIATVANCAPVRKVTIIPRNMALGVTYSLPEEDRYLSTDKDLLSQIQMLFGGRLAEKLVYEDYSTGASDDLKRATSIARNMVMRFGMSDKVGPVVHVEERGPMYLDQRLEENASHSEQTLHLIDEEIKKILIENEKIASDHLLKHRKALEAMADALMKRETIDGDTVREIIRTFIS